MRSPNNAPPVRRFEGRPRARPIRLTDPEPRSGRSVRNLTSNSSRTELFPAPPVPVIPSTGADDRMCPGSAARSAASSPSLSAKLISRAAAPFRRSGSSPARSSLSEAKEARGRAARASPASPNMSATMPSMPSTRSSRGVDPRHPVRLEGSRLFGADHSSAATEDPDVASVPPPATDQPDSGRTRCAPPGRRTRRWRPRPPRAPRRLSPRRLGCAQGERLRRHPLQQPSEYVDRGIVTVKQRGPVMKRSGSSASGSKGAREAGDRAGDRVTGVLNSTARDGVM